MAAIGRKTYTYKPTVLDASSGIPEQSVRVYIYDDDLDLVVDGDVIQTDAQGTIPEQVLENQVQTDSGSGFVQNLETPHKIILTKYVGTFGLSIQTQAATIASEGTPDLFTGQNQFITLDQAAVDAIGFFNVNTGTGVITIGQPKTTTQFFHQGFNYYTFDPIPDLDYLVFTGDGNNFVCEYTAIFTGAAVVLDLEGKSLGAVPGKLFSFQNGAKPDNGTISGNANLVNTSDIPDIDGVNFLGNVDVSPTANSVCNWNNVSIAGNLENTNPSFNVEINLTGASSIPNVVDPGTGPGQINLITGLSTFDFTVSPVPTPNYEWRLYSVTALGSLAGSVELDGLENETASGKSYQHTFTNQPAALQIISDDFVESVTYFSLSSSDLSINVPLTVDTND